MRKPEELNTGASDFVQQLGKSYDHEPRAKGSKYLPFPIESLYKLGNMREDRKGVDSKKENDGNTRKSTASINHACIITP